MKKRWPNAKIVVDGSLFAEIPIDSCFYAIFYMRNISLRVADVQSSFVVASNMYKNVNLYFFFRLEQPRVRCDC